MTSDFIGPSKTAWKMRKKSGNFEKLSLESLEKSGNFYEMSHENPAIPVWPLGESSVI